MRVLLATALTIACCSAGFAQTDAHSYSKVDRYAGCLVGYLLPALRKGASHDGAMAVAADRCFSFSKGLSERDLREVADEVNFFVTMHEQ